MNNLNPREGQQSLQVRRGTSGMKTRNDRPPTGARTSKSQVHISVCVCTFKRPALVADLLRALLRQATEAKFTYSIVVVDNDFQGSARETVGRFQREHP